MEQAAMNDPTKRIRRRLAGVTPQDTSTAGRPVLYAYGYGWIADLARCPEQAVRDAVSRGKVDPSDPLDCVRWIAHRRGLDDVADALEGL